MSVPYLILEPEEDPLPIWAVGFGPYCVADDGGGHGGDGDSQTQLIAPGLQAKTHGVIFVSGLHEAQVYLTLFRCPSITAATVLSSKSITSTTNSRAD